MLRRVIYIESCLSPISHSSLVVCSLDMSQNPTTVATPFPLRPLPSSSTGLNATHNSSRLPLFSSMSEKALLQQISANRPETDLQASSIPPDLSPSLIVPAVSVSVLNTHASDSNLNIEALTLLNEPYDSSPSTGPQGPPEPNRAAANNDADRLRYLSGSSPPAYRPNNE